MTNVKYPIDLNSKLILAPMAGVTNVAFRILCKKMGAGICYTEFLSADALLKYKDQLKGENPIFDVVNEERPVVTQVFGEDPEKIWEAAKSLEGRTDVIDLNIGCPAPKIMACGGGSALLRNPAQIRAILERLNTLSTPISCKIRLGIDENHINALEVAKIAEETGCVAIAVHGRTQKQGYSGEADWDWIKRVKESVNIPVIGNGDVSSPEDVKRMLEETGCDYVMVGRAAMKDPFFFKKANYYLKTGEILPDLDFSEKIALLSEYISLLKRYNIYSTQLAKSAVMQFTKGYTGGKEIRGSISKLKTDEEISAFIAGLSSSA